MQVLLVEPNHVEARTTELSLKAEGFDVYRTARGEEAVEFGKLFEYAIILLELDLSDISGFEVLRALRDARVNTPVMVFSCASAATLEHKVRALNLGADDYVAKPFHQEEIIARVRAIVRRSNGHAHSILGVGNIALDLQERVIRVGTARVQVTRKEYQVLELLFLHQGKVVSRERLMGHLYAGKNESYSETIDTFICKLRKKIAGVNRGIHPIKTVWGVGYMVSTESCNGAAGRQPRFLEKMPKFFIL